MAKKKLIRRYRVWTGSKGNETVLVSQLTKAQAEKICRALPKNHAHRIQSYNSVR